MPSLDTVINGYSEMATKTQAQFRETTNAMREQMDRVQSQVNELKKATNCMLIGVSHDGTFEMCIKGIDAELEHLKKLMKNAGDLQIYYNTFMSTVENLKNIS